MWGSMAECKYIRPFVLLSLSCANSVDFVIFDRMSRGCRPTVAGALPYALGGRVIHISPKCFETAAVYSKRKQKKRVSIGKIRRS